MAVNNVVILLIGVMVIPLCCTTAYHSSVSMFQLGSDATHLTLLKGPAPKGCYFNGYEPAYNKVTVEQIEAQKSTMAKVSGGGGLLDLLFKDIGYTKAEAARSGAREVIDFAAAISTRLAKRAPYIGPILGFIGAVVGGVQPDTNMPTQQILDSVDASIHMLTVDVNKRMKELKNYVDAEVRTKVLTLVKDMLSSKFTQWKECALRIGPDEQEDCSEECGWNLHGTIGLYRKFKTEFENNQTITGKDVMTLEAYLITTRDYVDIFLLVAKSIIEANINSNATLGKQKAKRFAQLLSKRSQYFIDYFSWAVKQITDWNKGYGNDNGNEVVSKTGNGNFNWVTFGRAVSKSYANRTVHPGQCADTLTCDDASNINGRRTAICRCKFLKDSNQMCEVTLSSTVDGSKYNEMEDRYYMYIKINDDEKQNFQGNSVEKMKFWKAGLLLLTSWADAYVKASLPIIEKYWYQEVTNLTASIQTANAYAGKALTQLEGVDMDGFMDRKHEKV